MLVLGIDPSSYQLALGLYGAEGLIDVTLCPSAVPYSPKLPLWQRVTGLSRDLATVVEGVCQRYYGEFYADAIVLAYEQENNFASVHAARAMIALETVINLVAAGLNLRTLAVNNSQWKANLGLKIKPGTPREQQKAKVAAAIAALFPTQTFTQDEADAVGIAMFAYKELTCPSVSVPVATGRKRTRATSSAAG